MGVLVGAIYCSHRSLRFPRSYAFPYIPTRHGIRYLCHADTLHAHVHAPWLRPRDSCTLCPEGSGVPLYRGVLVGAIYCSAVFPAAEWQWNNLLCGLHLQHLGP